jgi:long-chain fatty acid transport protein
MSNRLRFSASPALLALIVSGALAPQAMASGFQLREQGASAMGNAYATAAAGGFDISGMFYNPAALSLYGSDAFIGFTSIMPSAKMEGAQAHSAWGKPVDGPSSYGNSVNAPPLPTLYASWRANDKLNFGVSLNVPFGMVVEYPDNFVGRYYTYKTDLKVIDLTPTVSYKLTPTWSVGVGAVIRRVEAEMTNAVDFGAIMGATAAQATGNLSYLNMAGTADGTAILKGKKTVFGFKVGTLFQPAEGVRIGVSYAGKTKVEIKDGTVEYLNVPAPLATTFNNGGGSVSINLPDTISGSISWDVSSIFNLGLQIERSGWSSLQELRVQFADPTWTGGDNVSTMAYKDTLYYALGASWKVSPDWTLRFGAGHETVPMDDAHRTPRVPDGERLNVDIGASYRFSKRMTFEMSYLHTFFKDGNIDLQAGSSSASENYFRGTLTGRFVNKADILAAAVKIAF